jgi:hypothetical protein
VDVVRDAALGVEFEIDPRFARTDAAAEPLEGADAAPPDLPSAHFIASDPAAGWIAALAMVAVKSEAGPGEDWLEPHLARARAAFTAWSPTSHTMLVPPEAARLAGRPAAHVRYRLAGGALEDASGGDAGEIPPTLVDSWTVRVAERDWLLALELMVQPPEHWEREREALELPFRSLDLV